jgi:hypothetical protein
MLFDLVTRTSSPKPGWPNPHGATATKKSQPAILEQPGSRWSNFFGGGNLVFCWGFWQKRVVGRGVLVVKLWWIAGESWEVDGQDSGSKNMPLFPDYS